MPASNAVPKPAAKSLPATRQVQSLRSQLRQHTEERLISSAVELFQQHGYRATSVADIAKAAGTTPTTFYRYFDGKADIARRLQDHINIDVKKTLAHLDGIKRPTRQAIRSWMDEYESMWQRMHILCDAFWEATSTEPELAAELVPVTFDLTAAMSKVASIPVGDARTKFQTRLVMLYLLMDRLLFLVNIQRRNSVGQRMLDEFSEIFSAALFPTDK
jgi:AcrR family transcriptional regulator